jgi:hypothetical protein
VPHHTIRHGQVQACIRMGDSIRFAPGTGVRTKLIRPKRRRNESAMLLGSLRFTPATGIFMRLPLSVQMLLPMPSDTGRRRHAFFTFVRALIRNAPRTGRRGGRSRQAGRTVVAKDSSLVQKKCTIFRNNKKRIGSQENRDPTDFGIGKYIVVNVL